jgi:translocation and assembly module TamA
LPRPTLKLIGASFLLLATTAYADISYKVEFVSTGDDALDAAIDEASQLSSLQDRIPDSEATLRSRVADDKGRLNAVARAYGYYDDTVEIAIDLAAQPAKVTVAVEPGPVYRLSAISVVPAPGTMLPPDVPILPADMGLAVGDPAIAAPVAAANAKIEHRYQDKGYPFARVTERKVVVDHAAMTMSVVYTVDTGLLSVFGDTRFNGLETVDPAYAARRLHWKPGDLYDLSLVERTRGALVGSELFSTVQVTTQKTDDAGPVVPMAVDVTERPPRSVSGGVSYASTEGVSATATWEHRNLFGAAEDLKLGLLVGQEASAVTADFRKPDIFPDTFGPSWDLVGNITVKRETADAYDSTGERIYGGFEYKGLPHIVLGVGLALEHAKITDYELVQRYTLIGIPFYGRRDVTDDLLNPTTGDRENMTFTPYTDPARGSLSFVTAKITGSVYRRLGADDTYVLAALAALGATAGVGLGDLPKDKRFYAGGGGSVRGYGFQRAGPIGIHDDPTGGLSSAEASLELRYKLTQSIGLVPFVDAGNVYDSNLPDLSRRLFIGTGIGLRYYTALGPLRFDLATPLHRRDGDGLIQIYVSLGQAF